MDTHKQFPTVAAALVIAATLLLAGCRREERVPAASSQGRETVHDEGPTTQARRSQAHDEPPTAGVRGADQHDVDRIVVAWLEANAVPATAEVRDALPGESFCLSVSRDRRGSVWGAAHLDLDRDGNDDEKWTLDEGRPARRRVSTGDDGTYDREDRWRDGRWVRKRGAW